MRGRDPATIGTGGRLRNERLPRESVGRVRPAVGAVLQARMRNEDNMCRSALAYPDHRGAQDRLQLKTLCDRAAGHGKA